MSEITIYSFLIGGSVSIALWLLYRIEIGIRELLAEVKQMKIDLIHEHRGAPLG